MREDGGAAVMTTAAYQPQISINHTGPSHILGGIRGWCFSHQICHGKASLKATTTKKILLDLITPLSGHVCLLSISWTGLGPNMSLGPSPTSKIHNALHFTLNNRRSTDLAAQRRDVIQALTDAKLGISPEHWLHILLVVLEINRETHLMSCISQGVHH